MNLPNKLTFLRLILAVPFIYFQFSDEDLLYACNSHHRFDGISKKT